MSLNFVTLELTDGASPFPKHTDGFRARWWTHRSVYQPQALAYRYFQTFIDGTEVARGEIKDAVVDTHIYPSLEGREATKQIWFFEVREGFRGQGIGRQFVEWITRQYPHDTFIAYSEQADQFWAAIGWEYCPDTGRRGPRGRPIFLQTPAD